MSTAGAPWTPQPDWAPPGTGAPGGGPPGPPSPRFDPGVPLGGSRPEPVDERPPSQRRELALIAILLAAAVTSALASLLSWRDYGRVVISNADETGWVLPDGSMGRGWVAVALGVVLAAAGVLLAAERGRAGRVLAVVGGVGLVLLAVLEWGLGAGELRTGPGTGVWLLLGVGVAVLVAVGALGTSGQATRPDPATG